MKEPLDVPLGTRVKFEVPNGPTVEGTLIGVTDLAQNGTLGWRNFRWAAPPESDHIEGESWYVVERDVPEPGGPEILPGSALEVI